MRGLMKSEVRSNRRTKLVNLIEYNCLAAIYLCGLLKNYSVEIIRCVNEGNIALQGPSKPFFLIDAESLPIRLPDCVHWVSYSFPGAKILVIGTEPQVDDMCELIRIGMHGIISPKEIGKINSAIESVMSDHLWVRHESLEQFARYSAVQAAPVKGRRQSIITQQESRIVTLLQQKYSNKEIGAVLGITERTVKFHVANIYQKVGAHDRSSALDLLRRANLCSSAFPDHLAQFTEAVHPVRAHGMELVSTQPAKAPKPSQSTLLRQATTDGTVRGSAKASIADGGV